MHCLKLLLKILLGWGSLRFIVEFHKDMEALQCQPPTLEPKATDHVPDMVRTIEQIIANGHGYAVEGDVFFDTASLQGYNRLSNRTQVRYGICGLIKCARPMNLLFCCGCEASYLHSAPVCQPWCLARSSRLLGAP